MMEGRSTRLKERVARLFRASSLLRSTCTQSATAIAATARNLAADIAEEPVFVPATSRRFHLHRSLSLPFSEEAPAHASRRSVDCGGCRPSRSAEQKARKKKKERRVRENGGFYETGETEGRVCPPTTPSSPSKSYYHYCFNGDEGRKKKKKRSTKKLLSNGYGFSTSSSVESGDDELGLFSSDEKEEAETETLFSSKSFSSDSSEFYQRPASKKKKKKKKSSKSSSFRRPQQRRDGFQPLVSLSERKKDAVAAEEKEEEGERGVAVVKRSRDPYGDFRSSMVEMIVERQTFGAAELERLLQAYLELNSRHHHPAILRAFSDIWEALFTN